MATFPDIAPSYGAQKSSKPKFTTVEFGDGFTQRLTYGIPSQMNPKEWTLSWNNVSETDADTIEAFLDARAEDCASFDWSPPDETSTYKWICPEWSKSVDYPTRSTINATFQQVFEP